jgi:hypothetical protein
LAVLTVPGGADSEATFQNFVQHARELGWLDGAGAPGYLRRSAPENGYSPFRTLIAGHIVRAA